MDVINMLLFGAFAAAPFFFAWRKAQKSADLAYWQVGEVRRELEELRSGPVKQASRSDSTPHNPDSQEAERRFLDVFLHRPVRTDEQSIEDFDALVQKSLESGMVQPELQLFRPRRTAPFVRPMLYPDLLILKEESPEDEAVAAAARSKKILLSGNVPHVDKSVRRPCRALKGLRNGL